MKRVLVLVPDNARAEWVEEIHECDTANEVYLLINMATKLIGDVCPKVKILIEIPDEDGRDDCDLILIYVQKRDWIKG